MTVSFYCPSCGKKVKAKEKYAGRQVQCPGCRAEVMVPPLEPVAATPAAAPAGPAPAPLGEGDSPAVKFQRTLSWDDGLDMTPMIDVTFLLLIFFTITAAFALQKSIAFPPPEMQEEGKTQNPDQQEDQDDWVEVTIDEESRVWLDDVEAVSSHELLRRLREKISGAGTDSTGMKWLSIVASGESRHERLVMVIDMGTEAGMEKIKVDTSEDE